MEDMGLALRVLQATAFDSCNDVWWRSDGEYAPVTFLVNCNDLFYWASADCEMVTMENISILEDSYKDCPTHGSFLFCSRVRGMRPQDAYYKYIDREYWPLFDACGEARENNFANPVSRKKVIEELDAQNAQRAKKQAVVAYRPTWYEKCLRKVDAWLSND